MSGLPARNPASTSPFAAAALLLAMLGLAACAAPTASMEQTAQAGSPAVQAWVTTSDRTRLLAREPDIAFTSGGALPDPIEVDPSLRYQEMVGFGAAITDASAWLIRHKLGADRRETLLQELFGRSPGLGLSFARLTIGATDFSRSHYSFDDVPPGQTDPDLTHFSIDANRTDVLPVVKRALALNPDLRVMASPWSAPAWMKTSGSLIKGSLRPEHYAVYSEYLVRYIEAYAREGVPLYAITVQNEPHFEPANYPGMRLDPAARARLIGQHLGPLMASRGLGTRILEWDHNWDEPDAPLAVLADAAARRYIDGVAWHCYAGDVSAQTAVRDAHPDKNVYFTECSGGEWDPDGLLWLTRNLIVRSTRAWAKGVLLWNLALDEKHGPHLGGCGHCRGVVTIDSSSGEITRNAEYYALAHASRFVRPGAHRIASSTLPGQLDTVAFLNADDGSLVLIVANSTAAERRFSVRQGTRTFQHDLPARSVATYLWLIHDNKVVNNAIFQE